MIFAIERGMRSVQEQLVPFPSCFSSGFDYDDQLITLHRHWQSSPAKAQRSLFTGQRSPANVVLLGSHGAGTSLSINCLSVVIEGSQIQKGSINGFKVELLLRPWNFWRRQVRQGSKRFEVDVYWDLRAAKFSGDPEPSSEYYVAVVSDDEVVLVVGDQKKEAFRRTGSRPSAIDDILVSKKDHVFGRRSSLPKPGSTRKGKIHEISIEFRGGNINNSSESDLDFEMVIRVDGNLAIQVRHLQWKFRGNGSFSVGGTNLVVCYDTHDWLFGSGLGHALFVFKHAPQPPSQSPVESSPPQSPHPIGGANSGDGSSDFCLFIYAWRVERSV